LLNKLDWRRYVFEMACAEEKHLAESQTSGK
jgi:hypothetical protein